MEREADKHNMHQILKDFPKQCEEALELGKDVKIDDVENVVATGIGGSAFVGDVLKCFLSPEIDIWINKDYTIPNFVNNKTLVLAISFSGNTEETLEACEKALEKGAKILGICKGGKLEALCREKGLPCIILPKLPEHMQTRCALGHLVFPLLNALENSGIISSKREECLAVISKLKSPLLEEKGKEITSSLMNKIPIIYTPAEFYCIGFGWKMRLNENSKVHAFSNHFPEANHNEMSAYQKASKNFHTILFLDKEGDSRTKRRMEMSAELIKERTLVGLEGPCLAKIFTSLHLGDWASYYLALASGVDPTEVPLQDKVKKTMQNNVL